MGGGQPALARLKRAVRTSPSPMLLSSGVHTPRLGTTVVKG